MKSREWFPMSPSSQFVREAVNLNDTLFRFMWESDSSFNDRRSQTPSVIVQ
jgi:hypothetical protein